MAQKMRVWLCFLPVSALYQALQLGPVQGDFLPVELQPMEVPTL